MNTLLGALSIRAKLLVLTIGFLFAYAAVGTLAARTLTRIQVNGPLYKSIVKDKDLLADVLPPPEYIIEAHLDAHRMLETDDPAARDALERRERQLRSEFEERHQYWMEQANPGRTKELLVEESYVPAEKYFEIFEHDFEPALRRGDRASARATLLGSMASTYDAHRAAIDSVVAGATEESATGERSTEELLRFDTALLFAVALVVAVVFVGVTAVVSRSIANPMQKAVGVLANVAQGDLTQRLDIATRDEVGQLAQALNGSVQAMAAALAKVKGVCLEVASASTQVSSDVEQIATGARTQASSLERTAASVEQLTATVKRNAENAREAERLAHSSREIAERGGGVVDAAVRAMRDITDASKRIAEIIATIDEIAFQTNLLALNAAVEAARAGEQGRGFAVVATEVRNLAQRSASAAKEIRTLIGDSVVKVNAGEKHVVESGKTLEEIVDAVKRVTDRMGEIAAASREQSIGIEEVNRAVMKMDEVTQSSSQRADQMSSTAVTLAANAEEMEHLVAQFRLDEASFLAAPSSTARKALPSAAVLDARSAVPAR